MDRIIKGVYQIKCKTTGQVYIGSAINIDSRWRTHFKQLAEKSHGNYKLQTLYCRNGGKDNFELSVVEEAPANFNRTQIFDLEQKWLDCTPKLLNIYKDARAHLKRIPIQEAAIAEKKPKQRPKKKFKSAKKYHFQKAPSKEPVERRIRRKTKTETGEVVAKEWSTTAKVGGQKLAKRKYASSGVSLKYYVNI